MKTPSDDLFQLIASLNLSEKRYCSIYLAKHGDDDNRYLKLFDLLKEQATYNSKAALQELGYSNKPNHYAVLKKQLYEQLLDALHQFDLFGNPEQQLLRSIHQCHLLLQKGLFAQCEKRMKSLSKTAEEMNHYEAQLQLQNLRMIMYARKYYRSVSEADLEQWQNDVQLVLYDLQTTATYRYTSSLIYKMQYEAGGRSKELAAKMKAIVKLPLFAKESNATTLRAQLDFYQVNALYHFTNLETDKAMSYNEKFLALLESKPVMQQQLADRYFSVLNNYLIDCLLLKKYDTLESGIAKLRSLPEIAAFKRLANFDANVFRLGYLLELNYKIARGNFAEAYKSVAAVKKGLAEYDERIVKHNRITLQYLLAYICFALAKYDEALDYLWPILQEKEAAVAEEVQLSARMLQILAHFEKKDELLLPALIKSIRRLIQDKDEAFDIQRAVLSFIHTSITKPLSADKWLALANSTVALSANKKTANSLNLFNYNVWAQAHAESLAFGKAWHSRATK